MNAAEQEDAEEDREKVRRGSANNSDEFAQEGKGGEYIVGRWSGCGDETGKVNNVGEELYTNTWYRVTHLL